MKKESGQIIHVFIPEQKFSYRIIDNLESFEKQLTVIRTPISFIKITDYYF